MDLKQPHQNTSLTEQLWTEMQCVLQAIKKSDQPNSCFPPSKKEVNKKLWGKIPPHIKKIQNLLDGSALVEKSLEGWLKDKWTDTDKHLVAVALELKRNVELLNKSTCSSSNLPKLETWQTFCEHVYFLVLNERHPKDRVSH